MRIKPAMVLGLAAAFAAAGVATVVMTTEPEAAEPVIKAFFWVSSSLFVWATVAAIFSLLGLRLAPALATGLVWLVGGLGLAILSRSAHLNQQLSLAMITATIIATVFIWIRSKKSGG